MYTKSFYITNLKDFLISLKKYKENNNDVLCENYIKNNSLCLINRYEEQKEKWLIKNISCKDNIITFKVSLLKYLNKKISYNFKTYDFVFEDCILKFIRTNSPLRRTIDKKYYIKDNKEFVSYVQYNDKFNDSFNLDYFNDVFLNIYKRIEKQDNKNIQIYHYCGKYLRIERNLITDEKRYFKRDSNSINFLWNPKDFGLKNNKYFLSQFLHVYFLLNKLFCKDLAKIIFDFSYKL